MSSVVSSASPRPIQTASRPSRRSQRTPISSKYECAARSKFIAQKRRIPLATTFDGNAHVESPLKMNLPRKLTRLASVPSEVDTDALSTAFPDLAGIPTQYIRDNLPVNELCAAVHAVQTSLPKNYNGLPKEVQILMNDAIAANCPTHMFAVHDASPLVGAKRRVKLFPIHELVFRVNCAHLPALPTPQPSTSSLNTTIPVVPLRLPSLETFPLLQTYLYTQQASTLLDSLAPPCEPDLLRLAQHARKIHGVWSNASALGVVDQRLYDVIEASWDRTVAAMQACS